MDRSYDRVFRYVFSSDDVAVIRDSGRRYDPDLSKKENDFLEPLGYFARANAGTTTEWKIVVWSFCFVLFV